MKKQILVALIPALLAPLVLNGSRGGSSLKWLALLLAPFAVKLLMEEASTTSTTV